MLMQPRQIVTPAQAAALEALCPPREQRHRREAMLFNIQRGQFGRRRIGSGGGGSGDANFSNVVLLSNMSGSNGSTTIPDQSSFALGNASVTGNAALSNAQSPFGGDTSCLFDGDGDQLTWVGSSALGSGAWTIELWVRMVTAGGFATLLALNDGAAGYLRIRYDAEDTNKFSVQGAASIIASSTSSLSTWYHLAVVRNSGTITLYVAGTSVGSVANSTNFTGATVFVGANIDISNLLSSNAYIGPVRLTRNVARYTANFTPPTANFPTSA